MAKNTAVAKQESPNQQVVQAARPIDHFRRQVELAAPTIAKMLPTHLSWEKFQSQLISAVSYDAKLLECTPASLIRAAAEAAELGLSLNRQLGEADILPVWNGRIKKLEAQMRPRFIGLMKLATQSGEVKGISAHIVHENDEFDYQFGTNAALTHKPPRKGGRGEWTHAYCTWKLANGETQFEVMDKDQILAIRERSQSKNQQGEVVGPWATDTLEMARKTVVKRASKYMPRSSEAFNRAVGLDNAYEGGEEPPHFTDVPIPDAVDVTEPMPPSAAGAKQAADLEAKIGKKGAAATPPTGATIKPLDLPDYNGVADWDAWTPKAMEALTALSADDRKKWYEMHRTIIDRAAEQAPDVAAAIEEAMA